MTLQDQRWQKSFWPQASPALDEVLVVPDGELIAGVLADAVADRRDLLILTVRNWDRSFGLHTEADQEGD